MIISRSNKFIFLHSRKTAGSSISVSLAKTLADQDIMIGCWPDAVDSNIPYNQAALCAAKSQKFRYYSSSVKNLLQGQGFSPGKKRMNKCIKDFYRKHHSFNAGAHSTAESVKAFLGEYWDEAFKFCFVRNPWDHAVSDYSWRRGEKKGITFKEFLYLLKDSNRHDPKKVRPPIITNWSVYTINDHIVADYVGRFENLEKDLEKIESIIGVEIIQGMELKKSSARSRSKSLKSFYDDEVVELVRTIYRNEIEAFRYHVPF